MKKSLIIRNGRLMAGNPAQEIAGDLLITDGRIRAVGSIPSVPGAVQEIDAQGCWVLPGLIDPHAHYLSDKPHGYRMMIAAGVTTALEPIALVGNASRQQIKTVDTGLNCTAFYLLIPERNISGRDPSEDEIAQAIAKSREEGFTGIKIAGAHFPFTPEAMGRFITIAAAERCPLMIHAGTTANRDDIEGMAEVVQSGGNRPFILAHVNTYCTGNDCETQLSAAERAVQMLEENPRIVSESTFSTFSGVGCRIINGVPESLCMQDMLKRNGFEVSYEGLLDALECGKFSACGEVGDVYEWLSPEESVKLCREKNGLVTVRVPSHFAEKNIRIASARRRNGKFMVNAFSSDGGIIPRNIILRSGLECVAQKVFSMSDFVEKSAFAGAVLLGLENRKGIIAEGYDGDVVIVGKNNAEVDYTISGGTAVYQRGVFLPAPNLYIAQLDHTPNWLC